MARTVDEAFFHTKKRDRKFYFTTSFELKNGTPDEIRTHDLLLRRQTLYPAELRVPMSLLYTILAFFDF